MRVMVRNATVCQKQFVEHPSVGTTFTRTAASGCECLIRSTSTIFGVWSPAHGNEWIEVFLWSPYVVTPGQPQVFVPGDWIPYLRALAACRSRELLDWRAAHWNPGASRKIVAS